MLASNAGITCASCTASRFGGQLMHDVRMHAAASCRIGRRPCSRRDRRAGMPAAWRKSVRQSRLCSIDSHKASDAVVTVGSSVESAWITATSKGMTLLACRRDPSILLPRPTPADMHLPQSMNTHVSEAWHANVRSCWHLALTQITARTVVAAEAWPRPQCPRL